jgi:hypothetical protein
MSGSIPIAMRAYGAGSLIIVITLLGNSAAGDTPLPDVAHVEEDWQLIVDEPQTNNNGPQVTCSISPRDMNSGYVALDLNYHTLPYCAGGLQMHSWTPYNPIVTRDFSPTAMLATPGETITWTQTMGIRDGRLWFRVMNGQSQTWGPFGGRGTGIFIGTDFPNLNGYDPNVSVNNSGVSFASNLVTSLTLQAVRWYDVNRNLIKQTTDPRVVYPKQ